MVILDTDHMSELFREALNAKSLIDRLSRTTEFRATTIVTAEELLRGRLAQTAKARSGGSLIESYARLHTTLAGLKHFRILPFDIGSARILEQLRGQRLGVGTMDLRIASIAIANNATLLSRNLRDFERVPGLTVEDWLQ